jgi:capsular polysaccharide biosynthesis protein
MDDRIEFNKYATAIWRGKWLILAAAVIAGAATAAYRYRQPPTYTAEALIRIGRVWKEPLEDPYVTAEFINSQGFIDDVAHKLSMKPGQLRRAVRAAAVTAGPQRSSYAILVRITSSTDSSDQSIQIAERVANEVVAAHQAVFDQAIAPHLETQRRLEELARANAPTTNASLDAQLKLDQELGEIKSSNTSPTMTEKTRLLGPAARQSVTKPEVWQPAAIAAFAAAAVAVAAAVLIGLAGDRQPVPRQPAPLAAADKELSDVTPG